MEMLILLGFGGVLCGWSLLLLFSGERQRRITESLNAAPTVPQKKNN